MPNNKLPVNEISLQRELGVFLLQDSSENQTTPYQRNYCIRHQLLLFFSFLIVCMCRIHTISDDYRLEYTTGAQRRSTLSFMKMQGAPPVDEKSTSPDICVVVNRAPRALQNLDAFHSRLHFKKEKKRRSERQNSIMKTTRKRRERERLLQFDLLPRREAILESVFDGSLAMRAGQSIRRRHGLCCTHTHKREKTAMLFPPFVVRTTPPPPTSLHLCSSARHQSTWNTHSIRLPGGFLQEIGGKKMKKLVSYLKKKQKEEGQHTATNCPVTTFDASH